MSDITVIGVLQAQPGKEDELAGVLGGLLEPSRAEEGCRAYALHRGIADPARFAMVERWASQEAIDTHMASPHLGAALEALGSLLAAPPEITQYDAVEA